MATERVDFGEKNVSENLKWNCMVCLKRVELFKT